MWIETFGEIELIWFFVFASIAVINLVLAVIALVLGCIVKRPRTPGQNLDQFMVLGCVCLMLPSVFKAFQPKWSTPSVLESFCQIQIAFYTVGFSLLNGALVVRSGSICHYCKGHVNSEGRGIMSALWMVIITIFSAFLVILWALRYTPYLEPQMKVYTNGTVIQGDIYFCNGEMIDNFEIGLASYFFLLLLVAAIVVWAALDESRHTFACIDAQVLAVITYNELGAVIGGMLVKFILEATPTLHYIINAGIIMYTVFITQLALCVNTYLGSRYIANSPSVGYEPYYSEIHDNPVHMLNSDFIPTSILTNKQTAIGDSISSKASSEKRVCFSSDTLERDERRFATDMIQSGQNPYIDDPTSAIETELRIMDDPEAFNY